MLIAAVILLAAYLIRGVTGFGSALLAVPLLVLFLPLRFVVPWIATLDVVAALLLTGFGWRANEVEWKEVSLLLPAAGGGIAVGVALLAELPPAWLSRVLGLLVVVFGVRSVLNLQGSTRVSAWWSLPAGLAGGAIGALFATGGPPFVIYLSHRIRDKSRLRGTLSGLFLIEGGIRLAVLGAAGLLVQKGMLEALLLGIPLMVVGLYGGHHVHLNLSQRRLFALIGVLLVGSGTVLLLR